MAVLTVALTGGIATGKSIVAAVLRECGCYVESADRVAGELMNPGRKAWREVLAHFGPGILNLNRSVNRRKLASIIFADERERRFVNSVVHPLVMAEKKRTVRRLAKLGPQKIYVSEAALTVEAGFAGFFDRLIVTDCPRAVQVERLIDRDGIGRREALRRVRAQASRAARRRLADFIIDTSGSVENTMRQAKEICEILRREARQKQRREKTADGAGGRLRRAARRPEEGP
jgi:dephospho-CoA kinase